ncbi:MAG: hypothetical protein KAI81_09415, partial [Candidatus Marinimicrobia bacterium]|nr:hypothetical protein [Candidatus Neomarinimicrobiota bacterium]
MNYLSRTKSPLNSLIFVLPAALFYEIAIFIINRSDTVGVRNTADIVLKRLLGQLGFEGFQASILLFILIFLTVSLIHGIRLEGGQSQWYYFPLIILESAVYGALMVLLFSYMLRTHVTLSGAFPDMQHIVFSFGAGVYEELLFRGILLQGLIIMLARVEGI